MSYLPYVWHFSSIIRFPWWDQYCSWLNIKAKLWDLPYLIWNWPTTVAMLLPFWLGMVWSQAVGRKTFSRLCCCSVDASGNNHHCIRPQARFHRCLCKWIQLKALEIVSIPAFLFGDSFPPDKCWKEVFLGFLSSGSWLSIEAKLWALPY